MRLTIRVIMIVMITFFSAGYISAESSEEITLSNGEVVEVNFDKRTNGYKYEVKFKNGHIYFYEKSETVAYGGGSKELTSVEENLAKEAIEKYEEIHGAITDEKPSKNPIGIFIMIAGLIIAVFPRIAWFLEIGWMLHDAEPSELFLTANRALGFVLLLVGLSFLIT